MTRNDDSDVHRLQRSTIAYEKQADLFVSIHANSAGSRHNVAGIETFYVSKQAISNKNLSIDSKEKDRYLISSWDSCVKKNREKSQMLAQCIQTNILKTLNNQGISTPDRGVREEGYCVLLRSSIPLSLEPVRFIPVSLVEVGFLTNKNEAARLAQPAYRALVAQGIYRGIKQFIYSEGTL